MTGKIILPSGNLIVKDGNNQTVLNRADINKIYGSISGPNGIIIIRLLYILLMELYSQKLLLLKMKMMMILLF